MSIGHIRSRVYHFMTIQELLDFWGMNLEGVARHSEHLRDFFYQINNIESNAFDHFFGLCRGPLANPKLFYEILVLGTKHGLLNIGEYNENHNAKNKFTIVVEIIFSIFASTPNSEDEKWLIASFLFLLDHYPIPMNKPIQSRFKNQNFDHLITIYGYILLYYMGHLYRRGGTTWQFLCDVFERCPLPSGYLPNYPGVYGIMNITENNDFISNVELCCKLYPNEISMCVLLGKMELSIAGDEPESVLAALERRQYNDTARRLKLLEIKKQYFMIKEELEKLEKKHEDGTYGKMIQVLKNYKA